MIIHHHTFLDGGPDSVRFRFGRGFIVYMGHGTLTPAGGNIVAMLMTYYYYEEC